jgi:hypothetical protein
MLSAGRGKPLGQTQAVYADVALDMTSPLRNGCGSTRAMTLLNWVGRKLFRARGGLGAARQGVVNGPSWFNRRATGYATNETEGAIAVMPADDPMWNQQKERLRLSPREDDRSPSEEGWFSCINLSAFWG